MLKKTLSSLAAFATVYSVQSASADSWRSDRRFILGTGLSVDKPAPAMNIEYRDGFEHEMYFGGDFSMYGKLDFQLKMDFTSKLYLFAADLGYSLKAFEKLRTGKKGLEEKVTKMTLHTGSAAGGIAFGEKLTRGTRNTLNNSLLYGGGEAHFVLEHATDGKADANFFRVKAGTYIGGIVATGKPALLLMLRVEEEKRLTKAWGLGVASESMKVFFAEDAGFRFLQILDAYAKVKLDKKTKLISLPTKYAFGLRYMYFEGHEMRHILMLTGMMEM